MIRCTQRIAAAVVIGTITTIVSIISCTVWLIRHEDARDAKEAEAIRLAQVANSMAAQAERDAQMALANVGILHQKLDDGLTDVRGDLRELKTILGYEDTKRKDH